MEDLGLFNAEAAEENLERLHYLREDDSRGRGRVRGASGARDAADGRGRTRGGLTSSFSARAQEYLSLRMILDNDSRT